MAISILQKRDTDMTSGSIVRHLMLFAVPLLIGNVFQQLYNTVDSVVVGNFVGKEALAAVGSVGPIINMLIGFFSGLATGAGVVISQHYGAHDDERVHSAVHTAILLVLCMCVVLTAVGVLMAPTMVRMMSTPEDVMAESITYLRVYFGGLTGLLLYNIGAGILRAVGDSRRPLYFLMFSAGVNTVLDLLFVAVFRWGIAGAAYATIAAQGLSAMLVLVTLSRSKGPYRICWRDLRFDPVILKRIFSIGMPAAVQMAITSFSNVFVQKYVNDFGSSCMAGWTSYNKVDSFAILPMMSLSMAATTFVGQNLGAGNPERAREGSRKTLILTLLITGTILIPLMIFAPFMISLFNQDPEVIAYGTLFIRLISPFYLLCTINQVLAGTMRGAGATKIPMILSLLSFVGFRQLYLFVASALSDSVIVVAMGYPAGWLLCSALMLLYYRYGKWTKKYEKR